LTHFSYHLEYSAASVEAVTVEFRFPEVLTAESRHQDNIVNRG